MKENRSQIFLPIGFVVCSMLIFGCGAAPTGSSGPGPSSGSNVQALSVNGGPASEIYDGAFTSVTVCPPGNSSNCQTISGILVDTGSSGLRILSAALSASLPAQTNSSGNPIAECAAFADGITWGAVVTADVKISGEMASSMPIQVIGPANLPNIPADCTGQGVPMDDLPTLGANGLLGLASFIQDCGSACVLSAQPKYYACVSAVCADTTEGLAEQVQNPVASFATDNNGTIIEFPSLTGGEPTASGSLIFGIGTQSNNGLGSAKVFGTDVYDDFTTTYNNNVYSSFLDSGSNGIYFLDPGTTGFPLCSGNYNYLYCPSSPLSITVTNNAFGGTNGASGTVTFTVENETPLLLSGNDAAINGVGGPGPIAGSSLFDFGLPFFFGRNVFTAIEGKNTPGGIGPYIAY
jgi:hypothetical protein